MVMSYRVPVRIERNGQYEIKFVYVRAAKKETALKCAERRAALMWPEADRYTAFETGQYKIQEVL
jgi:hypothetical protein